MQPQSHKTMRVPSTDSWLRLLVRGGEAGLVPGASGRRRVLPGPARPAAERADSQSQADAAPARQGGRPAALGHRSGWGVPPEAPEDQHVSLAYDDELTEDVKRQLQEEWGEEREVTLQFHRFGNGASGELSLKWDPVANSESVQKAHKMGYYGQDKRGDWARPLHVSF